jgi:hypothetical protein
MGISTERLEREAEMLHTQVLSTQQLTDEWTLVVFDNPHILPNTDPGVRFHTAQLWNTETGEIREQPVQLHGRWIARAHRRASKLDTRPFPTPHSLVNP